MIVQRNNLNQKMPKNKRCIYVFALFKPLKLYNIVQKKINLVFHRIHRSSGLLDIALHLYNKNHIEEKYCLYNFTS